MKKFIIIFTFLTIFFNIFPQEKSENQDKSYFQINTKYFQIIYQPKSLETATIIAENADRIYEEIAKKLGISRSYVSRIEKAATLKLMEYLK